MAAVLAISEVLRPERRWAAGHGRGSVLVAERGDGGPSVAYGCLGWSIFFAALNEALPGRGFADLAEQWYDLSFATPTVGHSLLTGCAGAGWTTRYLDGRVFELEAAEDADEELEAAFAALIAEADAATDWAYEKGLLSCGVYFVARLPAPAARRSLAELVDYFDRTAERDAAGVSWRIHPEAFRYVEDAARFPNGVCSLTAAHGMTGVLPVLAHAAAAGIAADKARELLAGAVSWIASHELPADHPVAFPEVVADGTPVLVDGRLSWCRGDLGVAAVLMGVARTLDDGDLAAYAGRLAQRVLRRRGPAANIEGLELCHGTAGAAHLANRLFQATGDEELGAAARHWVGETLAMRRRELVDTAGFWAWQRRFLPDGPFVHQPDRSLIVGAAGIGLALLAAVSDVEPSWDRILLL
jgi:hypothetical protein